MMKYILNMMAVVMALCVMATAALAGDFEQKLSSDLIVAGKHEEGVHVLWLSRNEKDRQKALELTAGLPKAGKDYTYMIVDSLLVRVSPTPLREAGMITFKSTKPLRDAYEGRDPSRRVAKDLIDILVTPKGKDSIYTPKTVVAAWLTHNALFGSPRLTSLNTLYAAFSAQPKLTKKIKPRLIAGTVAVSTKGQESSKWAVKFMPWIEGDDATFQHIMVQGFANFGMAKTTLPKGVSAETRKVFDCMKRLDLVVAKGYTKKYPQVLTYVQMQTALNKKNWKAFAVLYKQNPKIFPDGASMIHDMASDLPPVYVPGLC